MTPAQVLSDFRAQIAGQTEFYTDAEVYRYMWIGETEFAKKIDCTPSTNTSLSTTAALKEYTRPTGIIKILRALWYNYPLQRIDYTQLDTVEGNSYGGVTTSGNPVYYYERGTTIGLSPTPATAQTIKLYTTVIPTEITVSSTSFTIPAEYTHGIVDYCLYRAYLKDMDKRSDVHLKLWEKYLDDSLQDWFSRENSNKKSYTRDVDAYPETILGVR